MSDPRLRIEVTRASLRSFVFGLLGLIPLLGLPFGILATLQYWRLNRDLRQEWNPAAAYLVWGLCLALLGLFLTGVLLLVVGLIVGRAIGEGRF